MTLTIGSLFTGYGGLDMAVEAGLPVGHVTDVPGLTRNEQLKALGNGVVRQQAEAGLRVLFDAMAAA